MQGETLETPEPRAEAEGKVLEPGQEPLPCCVLRTVEREGREVTVCVATCCDAAEAA
ncbi:MAG TPA: hypothetical protein VN282_18230 [Pyrinomonadaceae bacterium]|nr:hypothetical protein [Pyrinomonadaceae bacterium]